MQGFSNSQGAMTDIPIEGAKAASGGGVLGRITAARSGI